MKHLIIIGLLLASSLAFCQEETKNSNGIETRTNLHNLKMSISVDSAEELESVYQHENIVQLAYLVSGDEKITFELISNYHTAKKEVKLQKSYKIVGTTGQMDVLLVLIDKTRASAINDYKNR